MTSDAALPADIKLRHKPDVEHGLDWRFDRKKWSDQLAYGACRAMKLFSKLFFRKRYGHRAVILETVAAVPGMVGSAFTHFSSLRKMKRDSGRIRTLLDEAENERMHLMVFTEIAKPNIAERALIIGAQLATVGAYSLTYAFNKRAAHRFVGFLEEEAVKSYTEYLGEIDAGRIPNTPAPDMAKTYWNLKPDATLRDVVLAVRDDEAEHRDVNHRMASELESKSAEVWQARKSRIKSFFGR